MDTCDLIELELVVANIVDIAPKSDISSMEHPIFSLSKQKDLDTFRYETPKKDAWIEVVPSTHGRPTIFDKDLLLYCIGQIIEAKNRGRTVSRRIQITAYEYFISTGRGYSGGEYKRLHNALGRLRGTTIRTNITTKGTSNNNTSRGDVFGLIDDARIVESDGKTIGLEITLSDRLFNAINENHVLTYSRDYFKLSSPNERRMYELCRKHCGQQDMWQIDFEKLYLKFGSKSKINEFRRMFKKMVASQNIPDYFIKYSKDKKSELVSVVRDATGEVKAYAKSIES